MQEIHNRRVALGITCAQCTPVQLELLRRAGAMPVTSRRCGMITRREAERLCKSFLGDHSPPKLAENFAFDVSHCCACKLKFSKFILIQKFRRIIHSGGRVLIQHT